MNRQIGATLPKIASYSSACLLRRRVRLQKVLHIQPANVPTAWRNAIPHAYFTKMENRRDLLDKKTDGRSLGSSLLLPIAHLNGVPPCRSLKTASNEQVEVDGGRRDPIFSRMLKKIFRLSEKQMEYEQVMPEDINVTFNDVKGVSEAKSELQNVVQYLRNPQKFADLGARLPKGILLFGPPGTGKTLLARAVAGEAGVPFFHMAGPQEGMLAGQGAARISSLFTAAKAHAPCVVFIDEIDSVGRERTYCPSSPYANETVNQLLCEMDGFQQNEGVIVIGATNRRDALDEALLRSRRLDVEVQLAAPKLDGRRDILEHYLSKVKRGTDVDVDIIARRSIGLTGADLENMVNQAALKAVTEGAGSVTGKHLDFACDKIIMGGESKARIPDEEINWNTAYHESGHVIVAHYTKYADPVHKVTILPTGESLGHTALIPQTEQYNQTRSQLLAALDTLMGGRAAEELIFGSEKVTAGTSSDLEKATSIVRTMVKRLGMSEKVGLQTVGDKRELGPGMAELVNDEIKKILEDSYERAKKILQEHPKELQALAEALMKYETLDADAYKAVIENAPRN